MSEHCQKCGKPYDYVWRADDTLWQRVTGKEEEGLYCIKCFDLMAQEKGAGILYWECSEGDWEMF